MLVNAARAIRTEAWCVAVLCVVAMVAVEVGALNGPNVCMVKQKYNITKRVKYRAPMSVRTYEWCFSMPPRCSKWNTEMRDLTRLETEERTAEVAVCCPGYKMRDVSCVPICPNGKTGPGCSEACPDNKWGPNCIHDCKRCKNGFCSPITGECECLDGWQGESCDTSMPPTTSTTSLEELLTAFNTKLTTSNTTPKVTAPSNAVTSPRPPATTSTTTVAPPTTLVTIPTKPATSATVSTSPITTNKPISIILAVPVTTSTTTSTTAATTMSNTVTTTQREVETTTPIIKIIHKPKIDTTSTTSNNTTFVTTSTLKNHSVNERVTQKILIKSVHGNTKATEVIKPTQPTTEGTTATVIEQQATLEDFTQTEISKTTISTTPSTETTIKIETTKKETNIKIAPTTPKFKPKEIWIRPAQKGESPVVETKIKMTHDIPRYRSANNKELTPAITTPKTIIVSIIPTSVSYSTFKKIALTSSYLSTKNTTSIPSYNKTDYGLTTRSMLVVTPKPTTSLSTVAKKELSSTTPFASNSTFLPSTSVATTVTKPLEATKTILHINRTNSMTTDINKNIPTVTATSPNTISVTPKLNDLLTTPTTTTTKSIKNATTAMSSTEKAAKHFVKQKTFQKHENTSLVTKTYKTTNTPKVIEKEFKTANVTKSFNAVTTDGPADDEEFHILTEPEHITAVMGDKGTERSSVDLISVISIAGGVMMAIITVAVIIVMIERCKKPRYEDVRKINDIRMQVMIDNNDVPPPYVRSIFHTPLPEPPSSDRCHYQPISTLDRNLKQFMRPVVVQTISPIMLENFRGILECHYDHLPRRSNDFGTIQTRSSIAPSMHECTELHQLRASVTESTIEALKCEAKLDVIDNTTSEPLYAEIPCWRPPSEHAIEILNLNGEAVTEL